MELSPREIRLEKVIGALLRWFGTEKYRGKLNATLERGIRIDKGLSKEDSLDAPDKRDFAPKGTILEYRCSNCSQLCTYEVEYPRNQPPIYCSKKCQERRSENLRSYRGSGWECPTPKKTRFTSHFTASKTIAALAYKDPGFRWSYVYGCKCGGFHFTRKEYNVIMEAD